MVINFNAELMNLIDKYFLHLNLIFKLTVEI